MQGHQRSQFRVNLGETLRGLILFAEPNGSCCEMDKTRQAGVAVDEIR
jgi:hypothetical protein